MLSKTCETASRKAIKLSEHVVARDAVAIAYWEPGRRLKQEHVLCWSVGSLEIYKKIV